MLAHHNDGQAFQLTQVTKVYNGNVALAPTSLSVDEGERVAVLGPSGSGKTTLLHLLGGIIQPDGGAITLNGHTLLQQKQGWQISRLVGVIHQQYDLVPHLSVIHNVLAGRLGEWGIVRSLVSLVSPRDRHLALRALERVGLADKTYERSSRLSGGEQQRVAIARLLVQNPRVIIADEPVASLDPARAKDLLKLLSSIGAEEGKTLIASIHSVELAREFFTRAIGLRNGELQFDLPVERVTDDMLAGLYRLEGLAGEGVDQA